MTGSLPCSSLRTTDLPRYALGTAALPFDDGDDARLDATRAIRLAVSNGMRLVDTSPLYRFGTAEAGVGHALANLPRESYLLSTKVGYVMTEQTIAAMRTADPRVLNYPPQDFARDHVAASLERSLAQLKTSRIDIVFLHDPDFSQIATIRRGALKVLEDLRSGGAIGEIGLGVTTCAKAAALLEELDIKVLMLAGHYTLLNQDARGLIDTCAARGTSVLTAAPLNSGILANPYSDWPRMNYAPAQPQMIAQARRLDQVCRAHGVELRAAALQFPLRNPSISTAVTGPASVAELRDTLDMINRPIPQELWNALKDAGVES